jgi:hypothetical protein
MNIRKNLIITPPNTIIKKLLFGLFIPILIAINPIRKFNADIRIPKEKDL